MSMIAAAAAAAGALGTCGFMAGAAPWEQALNNVAATAQADSLTPLGHSSAAAAPGGQAKVGPVFSSANLDVIRSAAAAGGTGVRISAGHAPAAHQGTEIAAQRAIADRASRANGAATAKARAAAVIQVKAKARAAAIAKARAAAAARAKVRAAARPYQIYDSVTPSSLPSGQAAAVYVNGSYAAPASAAAGHRSLLWIDTNGSDPAANALDVEPGDATPAGAAQWVKARLSSRPHSVAIVYTMLSEWQDVKSNVAHLPGWMQSKVRYWIADPTGVQHIVPGASATQWYWGSSYDLTTANPNFNR
jgi:hypothetical protein